MQTVNVSSPAPFRCWQSAVLLAFMVVVATVWIAQKHGLATFPVSQVTFVTEARRQTHDTAGSAVHKHGPPTINAWGYGARSFRRPNRVVTEYDTAVAGRLASLVDRRATAADPELIRLIVDLLDPPSTHMVKMSRQLIATPQSREVDIILNNKVQPSPVDHVKLHRLNS